MESLEQRILRGIIEVLAEVRVGPVTAARLVDEPGDRTEHSVGVARDGAVSKLSLGATHIDDDWEGHSPRVAQLSSFVARLRDENFIEAVAHRTGDCAADLDHGRRARV